MYRVDKCEKFTASRVGSSQTVQQRGELLARDDRLARPPHHGGLGGVGIEPACTCLIVDAVGVGHRGAPVRGCLPMGTTLGRLCSGHRRESAHGLSVVGVRGMVDEPSRRELAVAGDDGGQHLSMERLCQ